MNQKARLLGAYCIAVPSTECTAMASLTVRSGKKEYLKSDWLELQPPSEYEFGYTMGLPMLRATERGSRTKRISTCTRIPICPPHSHHAMSITQKS